MAEPTVNRQSSTWNIPPASQSGDVGRIDRYIALKALKGTAIWVARPSEPREKEMMDILAESCRQMQINPVPRLLIYHSNKPNAASSITSSILFSTDLIDTMPKDQLKAVMGHELTHHKNRTHDLFVDLGINGAILTGYYLLHRHLSSTWERFAKSTAMKWAGALTAISGIEVLSYWQSRRREYRSDKGGAEVSSPDSMIDALDTLNKRLVVIYKEEEQQGKTHYWQKYAPRFLKTHPSHKDRVARIREEAALEPHPIAAR